MHASASLEIDWLPTAQKNILFRIRPFLYVDDRPVSSMSPPPSSWVVTWLISRADCTRGARSGLKSVPFKREQGGRKLHLWRWPLSWSPEWDTCFPLVPNLCLYLSISIPWTDWTASPSGEMKRNPLTSACRLTSHRDPFPCRFSPNPPPPLSSLLYLLHDAA